MFQFFNNFGDKIIEARLLFFSRLKSPVTSLSSTYTRLKAARPEVATNSGTFAVLQSCDSRGGTCLRLDFR